MLWSATNRAAVISAKSSRPRREKPAVTTSTTAMLPHGNIREQARLLWHTKNLSNSKTSTLLSGVINELHALRVASKERARIRPDDQVRWHRHQPRHVISGNA